MRVEFHGRGRFAVAYPLGNAVHGQAVVDHKRRAGVPIGYNKDKSGNPSNINGFRVWPYSFSTYFYAKILTK